MAFQANSQPKSCPDFSAWTPKGAQLIKRVQKPHYTNPLQVTEATSVQEPINHARMWRWRHFLEHSWNEDYTRANRRDDNDRSSAVTRNGYLETLQRSIRELAWKSTMYYCNVRDTEQYTETTQRWVKELACKSTMYCCRLWWTLRFVRSLEVFSLPLFVLKMIILRKMNSFDKCSITIYVAGWGRNFSIGH